MSVNLAKYKESLLSAWKDVLDDKSPTNWALYGYEGQTNDLKVVSKGTGGIEELIDDLNSGKIMYAFCKVTDPKTSLPKCVLINWQGEGAPFSRKGACANHVRDVGNLLKGAHLTLHARNEEEVEPQLVIDKVANAGSAYSFNERVESETGAGPVGTTYKRVIPRQEIDSTERDKFWEKEEKEEKQRQVEERQRRNEESTKLDQERKQRELNEAAAREEKIQVRTKNIFQQREAEKQAQAVQVSARGAEERGAEGGTGDEERQGRSDVLRRQRSQEAMSVISKRNFDARAIFEQNTSAGQMRNRSSLTHPHNAPAPQLSPTQQTPPAQHTAPAQQTSPAQQTPPAQHVSPVAQHVSPMQHVLPTSPSKTTPSWPPAAAADVAVSKPFNGTSETSPAYPALAVSSVPPPQPGDAAESQAPPVEDLYEEVEYNAGKAADAASNGLEDGELGLQARALYDYQAADETELTFDPGDIISHIDQIDEGWWQGLGPDGTFGLFPANYVELIH